MTRKTRLTSRWFCYQCDDHSDYGLTMDQASRLAQQHTNTTGHPTGTSTIPLHG